MDGDDGADMAWEAAGLGAREAFMGGLGAGVVLRRGAAVLGTAAGDQAAKTRWMSGGTKPPSRQRPTFFFRAQASASL